MNLEALPEVRLLSMSAGGIRESALLRGLTGTLWLILVRGLSESVEESIAYVSLREIMAREFRYGRPGTELSKHLLQTAM